jgi:hypothetical protein
VISDYAWARGRGGVVRMGPDNGPTILILPPLFEEANRMRRILVEVMRGLAAQGVASALPDLPGTNDSPIPTVDARLEDWGAAISALADTLPRPLLTVAIRGGALLDGFAAPDARWRLAPESGRRLLRDMLRATALTGTMKASQLETRARVAPEQLAGNLVHPELFVALEAAEPDAVAARTAIIGETTAPADIVFAGSPPWRRAEPEDDAALVAVMTGDIADWVKTCVAR